MALLACGAGVIVRVPLLLGILSAASEATRASLSATQDRPRLLCALCLLVSLTALASSQRETRARRTQSLVLRRIYTRIRHFITARLDLRRLRCFWT